MTDRTVAERQAALRERRRKQGIVRVEVFIHHTRKEEIRAIAETMQTPKE